MHVSNLLTYIVDLQNDELWEGKREQIYRIVGKFRAKFASFPFLQYIIWRSTVNLVDANVRDFHIMHSNC